MNPFCANEADYHRQVIRSIDLFPDQLKTQAGLYIYVWGHEVKMHDGGRGGGDGSADLLTMDEEGMVWLIEAKFGYNPELSGYVWDNQLARYRQSIEAMSWQRLVQYSEAFLKGRECTKPTDILSPDAGSFLEALCAWQQRIGRVVVAPAELNQRMASALKSGTYGIMVLADRFSQEVIDSGNRFRHDGPLAYVRGRPTAVGVDYQVYWYRPASGTGSSESRAVNLDPRFGAWEAEVNTCCKPDYFADTLGEGTRDLWLNVLRPGLFRLGWDGKPEQVKKMAFNVGFHVKSSLVPLLIIGWTEADAKSVPRHRKLAGQASMKVNPRLNVLLEASGSIDWVNRWASRFYSLGWRGRTSGGRNKRWGIEPITEHELKTFDGVMLYSPHTDTRDHCGRPGDRESLEGLLREFGVMLHELGRM